MENLSFYNVDFETIDAEIMAVLGRIGQRLSYNRILVTPALIRYACPSEYQGLEIQKYMGRVEIREIGNTPDEYPPEISAPTRDYYLSHYEAVKKIFTELKKLAFNELLALEKAAFAGDKIAIEKFDHMLKEQGSEEGWEGYYKMSLELSAQIARNVAEWEEHIKERDAIPYVKPIVDLAMSMAESENPLYRAMVSDMPYRSIYTKAKALEQEMLKSASTLPPIPTTDQLGQAQNRVTIPGLTGQTTLADIVKKLAKDTTSVVKPELSDVENDAARFRLLRDGDISGQAEKEPTTKKPNAQINQRAMMWRDLQGWMKLGNVQPIPKNCIAELKKKPAYKNMKISTKRMQKVLDEGFAGAYKELLKNI